MGKTSCSWIQLPMCPYSHISMLAHIETHTYMSMNAPDTNVPMCTFTHTQICTCSNPMHACLSIHMFIYLHTKHTYQCGCVTNTHIQMRVHMERNRDGGRGETAKPVPLSSHCAMWGSIPNLHMSPVIGDAPCPVFRTHSFFLYSEGHLEQDQGLCNTPQCKTK